MVEYCYSPGDASCPIKKIDKNKGQTIDFQIGQKLIVENLFNQVAIFTCNGEWSKIDDTHFEILLPCNTPLSPGEA